MKHTSLRAWLGLPRWLVILVAIALALTPIVQISTIQPAKIEIQLGGKK